MAESIETVVIGAGVVGLAIARRLALAGQEVLILESEPTIGSSVSSRNSEVIHAGLYYQKDSLRARLCLAGKRQLYDYCAAHGVPHRRLGKLVVATSDDQVPALQALRQRAIGNGVDDTVLLSPAEVARLEPAVRCVAALSSPSTGIIDSHALMLSLLGEAEAEGAVLARRSPVTGGRVSEAGIRLAIGGAAPLALDCRRVVNAASLGAQAIARSLAGLDPATVPPLHLAKGTYFTLTGKSPFGHLIYPMPGPTALGVHVTLDLAGRARFGPDIEWVDALDYDADPARAESFYGEIRRYWPELPDGALQPGYCGIRPKLQGDGEPVVDFVIQTAATHGIPGLVNLYGIDSPGLTSCLALADLVVAGLAGARN